jgi:hypothetical protein
VLLSSYYLIIVENSNNNSKAHVLRVKEWCCGDSKVVRIKVGDYGESKMFVDTVI